MPKRTIPIKSFVEDVRSGKTNTDLMQEYAIDASGLRNAFNKMLQIKAVRPEELERRMRSFPEAASGTDRRELPRRYVLFSFPVYVADDLESEGLVNDITEKGLQIAGITASVGETRNLLIRADEFADIFPFVFEATCRWVHAPNDPTECCAGFEIHSISEGSLAELRKLIQLLAFE
jgi:hypothetical protein